VLAGQIADQVRRYEIREERVEWALALVRTEGFARETDGTGAEVYTAEITYPKDREHLILLREAAGENPRDLGFHYAPYNFDSVPEREVFTMLLRELNVAPDEVEDIYFTGGLTDPAKTDFYVEYRGEDGRWTSTHRISSSASAALGPAPAACSSSRSRPTGTARRLPTTKPASRGARSRASPKAARPWPCASLRASTRSASSTSWSS
jgi:hypothetical protein